MPGSRIAASAIRMKVDSIAIRTAHLQIIDVDPSDSQKPALPAGFLHSGTCERLHARLLVCLPIRTRGPPVSHCAPIVRIRLTACIAPAQPEFATPRWMARSTLQPHAGRWCV